jgi:hypothetical protein
VETCAGPWRTSGDWWQDAPGPDAVRRCVGEAGWDHDEWDVLLEDGVTYRLYRERGGGHWFVDGVVD